MFKNNGTGLSKPRSNKVKLTSATLAAMLSMTLLTACAGTRGTVTTGERDPETERRARCAGWPNGRNVAYSASKDTPETIAFVRTYKGVGVRKGCWGAD